VAHATYLLPARERFGGQRLAPDLARALGRGDHETAHTAGESEPAARRKAQLRRHFRLLPDHWPLAALTRRVDAQDAPGACWLRADPAHLRAGINGATLLAVGDMLRVSAEESDALLRPLRPLFGDAGFPIDAPVPAHWYLRLPVEARPPVFSEPADALGADVFEHLPDGEAGRRWRSLLSEAEVVLHHHPVNAQRVAQGLLPVNSLWFWGGGVLPDHVSTAHARVHSEDEVVRAMAGASATAQALAPSYATPDGDALFDLRHARDLRALQTEWLQPALLDLQCARLESLRLDFEDGHAIALARPQRWRFWRRPLLQLHGGASPA
jgi:hypothetical protein